jgi:CDGSH-type Zn-finger protein
MFVVKYRLSVSSNEGEWHFTSSTTQGKTTTMADKTEALIIDHGPIKISGNVVLKDAKGQEFDLSGQRVVALCRCGHSENKPFCDGGHKAAGFQSELNAK